MAQGDAQPPGDQEVVGSIPAKVGNILSDWRLIMKYFLTTLDMTPLGWLGHKTLTQTSNFFLHVNIMLSGLLGQIKKYVCLG